MPSDEVFSVMFGALDSTLELLEYPELATREEVTKIHSLFGIVEDFAISVDSKSIDRSGVIPPQLMASCKEMGLFGQRVDPKFGGLGMTALESTVVAEALAYDASLFATLTCHEALGVKGLQMVGTDAQKEKYLPALASGEKMGAFCLAEVNSGTDVSSLLTRASLSADGKFYILNGRKAWVANGSRADLFTVFARTSIQNDKGESEEKVTAFLVERGLVGVQVEPPVEKLGLRGLDLVNVTFNNVRVPVENVLGEPGCGAELSAQIAGGERYLVGGLCAGICHNVIDALTEHCAMRQQFGRPLSQFGMVQRHLALAAANLYALESMTYLVAGLLTAQPKRDLRIESAAVKVFATETTLSLLNDCATLAGALGFTDQLPLERYLRDSWVLGSFMGVNDLLRLYIAASSLSIAGREMCEFVDKLRRPYQNKLYILRETFLKDVRLAMMRRRWRTPAVGATPMPVTERGVRASLLVRDHLHHNLRPLGDRLSRVVVHTHELARQALILNANNVNEDQFSLRLFSDLAIGLFAITAVLSRASRAKSIGIRYHNNELELAELFTVDMLDRLETMVANYKTKDNLCKRIASVILKENGYASASPLTRVW